MSDVNDDGPTEYRQYRFTLPPGAADILLVRHGESQPARLERAFPLVDGQADPPLDPRGRHEAELVADRLERERIAAIYVTTLRRTQETAAPLARRLGLQPRIEPDLREVHLGEWEGAVFRAKVAAGDPVMKQVFAQERWDPIPGAESTDGLVERVRAAVARIAAAHPDERVAVFTHGGVVATAAALATEARRFAFLGADNASITHLVVLGDDPPPDSGRRRWILRRYNDTGHLDTDLDRPPQPLT